MWLGVEHEWFGIVELERPGHRRAQVALLGEQAGVPVTLPRATQMRFAALGQGEVVLRVPPEQRGGLPAFDGLFTRVVADDVE